MSSRGRCMTRCRLLPAPLEYRLIGHDLVIRDKEADIIVGVLPNAVGPALTVIR